MNEVIVKQNRVQALERATFRTSRLLDFCSRKELVKQIGHDVSEWPLVIAKELIDNALDACEEAGVKPAIGVIADETGFTISDNGPGLPPEIVEGVLDFTARVSSRSAYVSPTRGQQGNALKTIVAMPFAATGEAGVVEIDSRGVRHHIKFSADLIAQEPVIKHTKCEGTYKFGTEICVHWPNSPCTYDEDTKERFLQILRSYAWLNPHLTIAFDLFDERHTISSTNTVWEKWRPSHPTSAHWYTAEQLERLIASYIKHDGEACRTIRAFVSEFRDLSGSAKQKAVVEAAGLSSGPLSSLIDGDRISENAIRRLLVAMREHSRPVKPVRLGPIGKDHFYQRLEEAGCEMASFEYRKIQSSEDNIPAVIEATFAWCKNGDGRQIVTGVNWSPSITNPFRSLGYRSLDAVLQNQRLDRYEDILVAIHISYPRISHTDHGKSAVALPLNLASDIVTVVEQVTERWAKQKRKEERNANAVLRREEALTRREKPISIVQAAREIMEKAYLEVSKNGTLPANARQIMYKARPYILERTGSDQLSDQYFTQTILPDYIEETGVDWDVAYDDRGHFVEPHTKKRIGLGTLAVRKYLNSVDHYRVPSPSFHGVDVRDWLFPTFGPAGRYGAVLFCEKEGFMPLFEAVRLAERYDIAIMSTKGMSVTAARRLADKLCFKYGIPLLMLRDFDIAGFTIAGTLERDTRRYKFENRIEVKDVGLRLDDVDGLESEPVAPIPEKSRDKIKDGLRLNGATEKEIEFLVDQSRRVEINAFASDELIAFIERKFDELGIRKVIPPDDTLARAYKRFSEQAAVQEVIDEAVNNFSKNSAAIDVPDDLRSQIEAKLEKHPGRSWDSVVGDLIDNRKREAGNVERH